MARNTGPDCRVCRREGEKLFLKGTRCFTHKCAIERREYAPGQHGTKRVKLSNFGLQLREKQKVKRIYGLLERQFRRYFHKAARSPGVTGSVLLELLERRLDNVIFQAGFSTSRSEARQIVSHGFVYVNARRVNIPSFWVQKDDEITLQKKGDELKPIKENLEATQQRKAPAWLKVDPNRFNVKILRIPQREDITFPVNEQLIIELYSR